MALRALKIMAELKKRNALIDALLIQKSGFNTRKSELESALKEAESDEDIKLVSDKIDELETEIAGADTDAKISAEQAEIDKLNVELSGISKPSETPTTDDSSPKPEERGIKKMISKRTIFGRLDEQTRNDILSDESVKDFLTSIRSTGNYKTRAVSNGVLTIPTIFLDLIRPSVDTYSKLYSVVRVRNVRGEARQNIIGTAPEAVWTEQFASLNESEFKYNQISIGGYKIGGYITIDNALLADSDENLSAEIIENLAQSIGRGLDRAIIYGTGVRMPLGIATRLSQTSQPNDWGTNAPAWTDLSTTNILKLDSAESATTGTAFFTALYGKLIKAKSDYATGDRVWIMNENTKATIIQKSIGVDSAAAIVAGTANEMPIIGGRIITLNFIPDGDIIGGYMDMYVLAERDGSSFAQSDQYKFVDDQTVFKGSARYDGKPTFGEGFVMVNINNTNPTITTTFAGDSANVKLVSLSALSIGTTPVTLFPPFSANVLNYTAKVTTHSNKITATSFEKDATISIKNGLASVSNGGNATFVTGDNKLTIEVTNGNATKRTYTVTIDDITA